MPKIEELAPVEEKFIVMHGRVPFPCCAEIVTERMFRFYDEDGRLFASLRIHVSHDALHGWHVQGYEKIYKAIFKQVFKELKPSNQRCVVRGSSRYDKECDKGVVFDVKREAVRK